MTAYTHTGTSYNDRYQTHIIDACTRAQNKIPRVPPSVGGGGVVETVVTLSPKFSPKSKTINLYQDYQGAGQVTIGR